MRPASESAVGDNARVEPARKGKNEIVRVRTSGRLTNDAVVDELLVAGAIVDLMPKRGVDDNDGLESFFGHLLAHRENVAELRLLALGRMGDVGPVDEDDRLAHGALRAFVRMLSVFAAPSFVVST